MTQQIDYVWRPPGIAAHGHIIVGREWARELQEAAVDLGHLHSSARTRPILHRH
jgi:hypothetical protein